MDSAQFLQFYYIFWLAVMGAVMGSFFECAAVRGELPKGRSRCDSCGHILGARDLVPIFSYLINRGRCRYCKKHIPIQCLVSETMGALLFASLGLKFGFGLNFLMQLIFGSLLLLLALVDWNTHILPNKFLLVAIINRLVFFVLLKQPVKQTLISMLIGALSVSLPVLLLSLAMDSLLNKESMGGGDIKLLFVLGLYLDWTEMLLLLFMGCVLALIWALIMKRKSFGKEIAFGPFLSLAWLTVILFGEPFIIWYKGLLV